MKLVTDTVSESGLLNGQHGSLHCKFNFSNDQRQHAKCLLVGWFTYGVVHRLHSHFFSYLVMYMGDLYAHRQSSLFLICTYLELKLPKQFIWRCSNLGTFEASILLNDNNFMVPRFVACTTKQCAYTLQYFKLFTL